MQEITDNYTLWFTWAGMGGVGRSPPDDPVNPPATALAGAANWTAWDSSGIVPVY